MDEIGQLLRAYQEAVRRFESCSTELTAMLADDHIPGPHLVAEEANARGAVLATRELLMAFLQNQPNWADFAQPITPSSTLKH